MTVITILALLLVCTSSIGCEMGDCKKGQGEPITTELSVEPFQQLILTSSLDVRLLQGPAQKVEVLGQSNLIEMISTEVVDGTWSVGIDECFRAKKSPVVHITIPQLAAITIKGSGDIISEGPFRTQAIDLNVQGSGNMDLDLQATRIKATVQGSGDVLLKGSTTTFESRTQGSGDVDALELVATDVRAAIMGTGDVAVQCTGLLDASIMGTGDIQYRGNPTEVRQSIKGTGSIRAVQ